MSPRRLTRGLSAEHRTKFFAYLDRLPPKDRPVYGFSGQRPSAWQFLGGGTAYVQVLFFPDHVVFSTRGMASRKETGREVRLLGEIASIGVDPGTLMSTATVHFVDGSTIRLRNVSRAEGAPLELFDAIGLAAFDRAGLEREAVSAFFVACSQVLPLPDGLFTEPE
jgi:hypothetical protein